MSSPATVIVLAGPAESANEQVRADPAKEARVLTATLQHVLATGLPALVVAQPEMTATARAILPANDVLTIAPDEQEMPADWLARAVRAGVEASPQAGGWLLVPLAEIPTPALELHAMADCLPRFPVVRPEPPSKGARPVGISGELFSELLRIDTVRDLHKLTSRYPSTVVTAAAGSSTGR